MPFLRTTTVRASAFAVLLALVAAACGPDPSGQQPAGDGSPGSADATSTGSATGLPDLTSAAAPVAEPAPLADATTPPPPQVPAEVEVRQPDVLVRPEEPGAAQLHAALAVDGVDHLAGAEELTASLVLPPPPPEAGPDAPAGPAELTVLAVDPLQFRPLTPRITAEEPGVWQRLLEGDVVVRHDVAERLGLSLGGTYELQGPSGVTDVRIGAFASNGAPPLAEVVVPWEVGNAIGGGDVNLLVIAVDDEADTDTVAENVVSTVGGGASETLAAPEEQRARIVGTVQHHFEPFDYTDLGDGMIVIDPAWVARWIGTVELPGLGVTRCHRMMIPQLIEALEEIQAAGLYGHFERDQFGGCYVPRHIDWNPAKPLSMHAWGLAIDFNTQDNWLGQPPQMDPRIVAIFEKWGFEWGGRWSRPDGMHFELDRVVQVQD